MSDKKMLIGVVNLAKELGVSRLSVYSYIKKGLPSYKISDRKIGFDVEEVYEWLKRNQIQ